MRKLKLQMNITTDGFAAGPNGELDWMEPETDKKQLQVLSELTESMDTIIMGRNMAAEFTSYWENVVDNEQDSPEYPYAKIFVDTHKIVFSKSISSVEGRNIVVEHRDLVESVNELKGLKGKDIIVYGGANFVSELIKNNLIDELNLFINPTVLGDGLRIFPDRYKLRLITSTVCKNGVLINKYRPTTD
ncbi:dihydrofolate reductase family protein [Dyadobacter bucti]|uniref:dihydrofolate reductase family protein n=1 Tax=Dyadobacter bucti TaxID=2572203 RepID=UPI003F70AC16